MLKCIYVNIQALNCKIVKLDVDKLKCNKNMICICCSTFFGGKITVSVLLGIYKMYSKMMCIQQ
jgi:hypothetical protein